ncbi:MAG TPA: hypothetical protein VFW29_08895 [Solirubrobacteraceae bacterium]|nr:hypothetical protein [Solirubrobacteraceae bacterium]
MSRKRLLGLLAAAAVLAGGALAAVTAAQGTGEHRHTKSALGAASSYLGVGEPQLRAELREGKTLGQVAAATSGKSAQGVIDAIVAARKAHLESQLQGLPVRVAEQVMHGHVGHVHAAARSAVAGYLGLTAAQLRAKLRSGATLAQIAGSTPGRSRAGLIAALVAAREKAIAAMVSDGLLTPARARAREARVPRIVEAAVDRVHRPGHGHALAQGRASFPAHR